MAPLVPQSRGNQSLTVSSDYYERGLAAHRSNDPRQAERFYKSALRMAPQHAPSLSMLGVLALQLGHALAAERLCLRSVWSGGATPDRLCNLAAVLQSTGRRSEARALYRRALVHSPSFGEAARNLAIIGIEEGDRGLALDWHRRIATTWPGSREEPGFDLALRLLEAAETDSRAQGHREEDRPRYLVIKPWACGFWGEVHHVITQIVIAEISGRTPVVLWNADCRYWVEGDANAWELFFEPVAEVRYEDLEAEGGSCFPPAWTLDRLRTQRVNYPPGEGTRNGIATTFALISDADVVVGDRYMEFRQALRLAPKGHPYSRIAPAVLYRRFFQSYIRPRPEVTSEIQRAAAQLFRGRPVIAAHYRAPTTDKQGESLEDNQVLPDRYFRTIDEFLVSRTDAAVFLLTDFEPAIHAFHARYGERLLTLPATRLSRDDEFEVGLNRAHNGHRLAWEVLRDTYMAGACDAFIGDGASGVSCAIMSLKTWLPGQATLVRANVFTERG
jgi:tetratricopeptide (TPR) repeat protein